MPIETVGTLRCEGCGTTRSITIRFRPIPATAGSLIQLSEPVRTYPICPISVDGYRDDLGNWKIDPSGRILCPACPQKAGPYR